MKPRLIVEQHITAFVNRYNVYQAKGDGEKGELIAFAQQKRIAMKEKFSFYDGKAKDNLLFTFRAEKVFDVHSKYLVEDASGNQLGAFRKHFRRSLLSSTWSILDSKNQPVLTVSESNKGLAAARRFIGWVPIIGELLELLTNLIKYHFSFRLADGGEEIGKYRKTTLFRDHYQLDMTDEAFTTEDWRVFAAFAVALDALQSR